MKNKDSDFIDKLAQDALENFEVEFDPMDWVDMQSKLSAESNVDKIARDALKDHEVPFDVRDWKRLEKQLDKKDHLYPAIWWIKSAEVGIVALLIFTIFNLSTNNNNNNETLQPNKNYDNTTTLTPSSSDSNLNNANKQSEDTYKINGKEAQPTTDENQVQAMLITDESNEVDDNSNMNKSSVSDNSNNTSSNTKDNSSNIKNIKNKNSRVYKKTTVATNNNSSNKNNNTNYTSIVSTTEDNGNEVPNQTGNSFTGEDGTTNNSIVTTRDHNNNSLTLNPSDLDRTENFATTVNKKNDVPETKSSNLTLTRSKFSILEITPVDAKNLLEPAPNTTDPLFELKKLKLDLPYHCKTFVGGVATIGANFANSMGGTSIGYGAGFVMDSELSARVALKSGLLFAFRKHELVENYTLESVDGSTSYDVEKTKVSNLVIVQVPLDLQYTFFKNEKWKIYVTTGVTANLIGSRSYTGSQKTTSQGLSVSTNINSDDYERGLFEGGQFTNNAFLSVGGGLGLERQLGDKISLYLLPTYRHAVTPIGADFMSSFSVNIGVKSSL